MSQKIFYRMVLEHLVLLEKWRMEALPALIFWEMP
jgi:hypothetical protein